MAGLEDRGERFGPTQMVFGLSIPAEMSEEDGLETSRIIVDHLYEGVLDLEYVDLRDLRSSRNLIAISKVTIERPLTPDDQLTDDDIYARALIGTYLEYVDPAPIRKIATNPAETL